jgi:hypothetical protein
MTRKQRRAAGAEPTNRQLTSAADIPLSHPNTTRGKEGKTLLEIAAERQAQLAPRRQPFPKSDNLRREAGAFGLWAVHGAGPQVCRFRRGYVLVSSES